jgi:hypothetical protein
MIRTRPRRLYHFKPADSFYYIIGGKRKKLKKAPEISQKQLAKINITNIVGVPQAKRIRKRRKKKTLKLQKSIDDNLLKPANQFNVPFFIPKKEIPDLSKLQSSDVKKAETTDEKLSKLIGELVSKEVSKLPKPISEEVKIPKEPILKAPEKPKSPPIVSVSDRISSIPSRVVTSPISEVETFVPPEPEMPALEEPVVKRTKKMSSNQMKKYIRDFVSQTEADTLDVPNMLRFIERGSKKKINVELLTSLVNQFNDLSAEQKAFIQKNGNAEIVGFGDDVNEPVIGGLFNDELERLLYYKTNKVVPVIASDELESLLKYVDAGQKYFAAVINSNPSTSDGSGEDGHPPGHWRAIFIDNRDDFPSAEYFDSLAEPPEKAVTKIMKRICEIMNPELMFLYKQNMVKLQNDTSSNCGQFCLKFIDDRVNGVPWVKATGFEDVVDMSKKGEKMIEKYKSYL